MTPADRQHLARILGMLGSDHAGERAAAGMQAEAFRKKHGLSWEEMLSPAAIEPEPTAAKPEADWPPYEPIQWHKVVLLAGFWVAILGAALVFH
jgi:hypothetical protein